MFSSSLRIVGRLCKRLASRLAACATFPLKIKQPVIELELVRLNNEAKPNALRVRTSPYRAQPSRWQRGAYVGFDLRDIHRVDHAIRIHVFPEIRATDRYAYLRFGQADIGGVNDGVAIHITDQNAHGNGNITSACAVIHVMERDRNSLDVGHASEIDRDLRPAHAETAHAPTARGYCHTLNRDRVREVNDHLIIVCGSAATTFPSLTASQRQRNIKGAGRAVALARSGARRRRCAWARPMQRQCLITAGSGIFPHGPNVVAAPDYSVKLVGACTHVWAWHQRPCAPVPMQRHCGTEHHAAHSPNVVAAAAHCTQLVLACITIGAWHPGPGAAIPMQCHRVIHVVKATIKADSPHIVAAATYSEKLVIYCAGVGAWHHGP